MAGEILDHLWQSTLFTAAIAPLTWICRRNRASVRHSLWLAASIKFLVPFSLLVWAGNQIDWATPSLVVAAPPAVPMFVENVAQPSTIFLISAPTPKAPTAFPSTQILFIGWLTGALAVAALYLRRLNRVRQVVRSATHLRMDSG